MPSYETDGSRASDLLTLYVAIEHWESHSNKILHILYMHTIQLYLLVAILDVATTNIIIKVKIFLPGSSVIAVSVDHMRRLLIFCLLGI